MAFTSVLVANRGEIAVRILRAAAERGLRTVAVHSADDAGALHTQLADDAVALPGVGPRAYLDAGALLAIAADTGCEAIHPGYGFLSEDAGFARAVATAGRCFIGPTPDTLALFGDKAQARAFAHTHGLPVLPGTDGPTTAAQARTFFAAMPSGGAMLIKAIAGGGGRGIRIVRTAAAIDEAWERCRSEAAAAFGRADVYVEALCAGARHLEIQIVGDGSGAVVALGERDCTLQRRHQKLIEMAPSPHLSSAQRAQLLRYAVQLGAAVRYAGIGTVEFLVAGEQIVFLEVNPRLQVEHTVTEMVSGVDLVQLQLQLAAGGSLADVGLSPDTVPGPRGLAVQVRINMETPLADGSVRPSTGTLTRFEPPVGPGVRVDTHGVAGYQPSAAFDSLLAKVIVHTATMDLPMALEKAARALAAFRIDGLTTNRSFLQQLLRHPDVRADRIDTGFVEAHLPALLAALPADAAEPSTPHAAGARIDATDPLAVLHHGRQQRRSGGTPPPPGTTVLRAPLQGTIVALSAEPGQHLAAGDAVLVMEAMKMEHVITAPSGGELLSLLVAVGDTVPDGAPLAHVNARDHAAITEAPMAAARDLDAIRPDLAEALARHAIGDDAARPDAVARRRHAGQRTARENLTDLCDPGSLIEYGALTIAAQRRRRALDDLIRRTPADGLVGGIGRVNGARCVVMSYDYTVLAGTQGLQNHRKKDRLFEIAAAQRLPVVVLTEGGGGRPGDTDGAGVAGLDCRAFQYFGALSGLVPLVGINSGYCFAGNAALLGCCDVVIAAENSSIGMGGPAMIEGGGLGVFRPDEVGPLTTQMANGVVDITVPDEAAAIATAKQYLAYFQGPTTTFSCADQRQLRHVIPENRVRVYDVRAVIETLADTDSVLELRRGFAPGMVTALARLAGRPVGIVANNPQHLAGAIDPDGADKAARFLQLCDAHDLPIVFLCDTPGIMVGPEVEKRAMVRHAARLFVVGASLTVPFCTVVLRKGYGLGAQAMAGGSFHAPIFTVAWPTGEFGGMGLEGAVKLGFRKELAAIDDPAERRATFEQMVARMYEVGKAVNMASHFEIDDVIDPADSRRWITAAFDAAPPPAPRTGKKRPCVDAW